MALPSSGPLSFSQIGAALCTPQSAPYSLRSMSSAAGFSTPDSVSEFYGYSCSNAYVDISNSTTSRSITNITINGVQVTGVVFPVVAGDGASGQTNQTGASNTIVVSYSGTGSAYCQVIDSDGTDCASATSTSRTFTGQLITNGDIIFVQMGDGPCP